MTSEDLLTLYELHAPMVFRRARQLVGHEPDAWDIVHDTFLALLEQERRFRAAPFPLAYIFGITTNLCFRRLRTRRIEAKVHARLIRSEDPAEGRGRSGDDKAIARDFLVQVAQALGRNERAFEVAVYKYLDGMTQEQIAAMMGVSRKTVQRDLDTLGQLAGDLALEPQRA